MSMLVFMFPGQSSRYPAMLEKLSANCPNASAAVLDEASDVLHRDVRRRYSADNPAMFATNRDIQIAVFLANHLCLHSLLASGIDAEISLGLSLGEYNHLVHIGALAFSDALKLVDVRGAAYDAGPHGCMASVFPLDLEAIEEVVARVSSVGAVEIVSYNSPTKHVIAGEASAVNAALVILAEEHFIEGVLIEDRIPMHSSVFGPVAISFRPELERAAWRIPNRAYVPNVEGRPFAAPSATFIVDALTRHVHQPVRWCESIEAIAGCHDDAAFLEVGPRSVLHNLLQRKWLSVRRYKMDTEDNLVTNFASVRKELANGSGPT